MSKVKIRKKKKSTLDPDSPNLRQALQSDDRNEWITAIQKELEQLELEKIWVIVATVPEFVRDKIIPST